MFRRRRLDAIRRFLLAVVVVENHHPGIGRDVDWSGPDGDVRVEADAALAVLTGALGRHHPDAQTARNATLARMQPTEVRARLHVPSTCWNDVTVFVERAGTALGDVGARAHPVP